MNKIHKPRHHYALFDRNLPFRSRVELSKVSYTRKEKHKGKLNDCN